MGLWNRLTRHQERGASFRLIRVEVATEAGLVNKVMPEWRKLRDPMIGRKLK